jgi:hypothetical protein
VIWRWTVRRRPRISVVVVVYDMAREAPRTLHSLAPGYQRGMDPAEYEVLVVDNGSPTPLGEAVVRAAGPCFRYHYIQDAVSSPAAAINQGVALTRGELVGVMIDGARMVTPGLLELAGRAARAYDDPVVTCLGWHLGPDLQQRSVAAGYSKAEEDRLLESIAWPEDGYRLFEIGVLAATSRGGCFRPAAESNAVFMHRDSYEALGGYDPAFDCPGGGFVNLDFFRRACERSTVRVVLLPGEGSFHQLHGGVSTNVAQEETRRRVAEWDAQYRQIRGREWAVPEYRPILFGPVPDSALTYIAWSVAESQRALGQAPGPAKSHCPAGTSTD